MATTIYFRLTDYNGKALAADGSAPPSTSLDSTKFDVANQQFFRVLSYSCDVAQTLNIGSQSTGAGAGKISFNPLVITKYQDAMSPTLFQMSAAGTAFRSAEVLVVTDQNVILSRQTFKLVAIKTIAWAASDEGGILETIAFDYGGLVITTNRQNADGKISTYQGGWNKVKNISDPNPDTPIK